jgi:hypothetical protein
MASWCLPKSESRKLLDAIKNGQINTLKLNSLDSAGRRAEFEKVLGPDLAKELNTNYERHVIVKGYQKGLSTWISDSLATLDKKVLNNIEGKINSLDQRILNPTNEKAFLSDLASDKLGFTLKPEQAKQIFEKAQEAKKLRSEWEKTLGQKIPRRAVNDPVSLVRTAYGRAILDLQDTVESMKPQGQTWLQRALDLASTPKTLATGVLHLSALGVQGWGMISHKVTWEAAAEQFKYFYDEENYKNLMAYIISHPDYKFAQAARLGLTDVTDQLSTREEAIQSTILQRMNEHVANKTGLPINVLGASSRAFTGFLNYTRFNRFVDLLEAARKNSDVELKPGDQIVNDLASVVNNFTGRANLDSTLVGVDAKSIDKFGGSNQQVLNALFFAPRKVAATIQMFNPLEYNRLYQNARETGNYTAINGAIRQLTGSLMATGAILYLANMMGYKVDYNPASANFAKIQTPSGEKLDITGGNAIWTRLIARILLDKEVTAHGKEIDLGEGYKPTTRADLVNQYVRGKLSPTLGTLVDWMYGKDAVGRPFDLESEARARMEPILLSTMLNYYYQQPDKAMSDIPVLASFFGVQTESPVSRGERFGMNPWGEPADTGFLGLHEPSRTNLDGVLDKVGYTQDFPSNTIQGVKLNDDQQKTYNQLYGQLSKARMTNLVQSPWFQNSPPGQQLKFIKQMSQMSKTMAQATVMGKHPEIIQQSLENRRKLLLGIEGQ